MEPKIGTEGFSDIPDKFYFNEMKREVIEASQLDRNAEQRTSSEFVDLGQLGDLIESSAEATSSDCTSIINRSKPVVDQLWDTFNHYYGDAVERRGYQCTDMREIMVCVSAAAIRTAAVVDSVKIDRIGMESPTMFTNALISRINMKAVMGVITQKPLDKDEDINAKFAAKLADDAYKKTAMETKGKSWAWAKVHSVAEMFRGVTTLREVLTELPEIGQADTEMLMRQNQALGEASQRLVTYTPKPSISLLEGTDIDALFVDREVVSHMYVSTRPSAEFTPVSLFPHTRLTSSNASLDFSRAHQGKGGIAKRINIEGSLSTTPHCELMIHRNQDLYLNSQSLEKIAKSIGAEGQAELLKSILLGKNFDLIVPSYIVDLANEEAENTPRNEESHPQADKLRRLLLARTRVLNVLGEDIIDEIDTEEQEDIERHRDMVKHKVEGFIRRLPNGYSAGQQARNMCLEELGVELPDGHTYVRRHDRGNLDVPSRGHKADKNPRSLGKLGIGISR